MSLRWLPAIAIPFFVGCLFGTTQPPSVVNAGTANAGAGGTPSGGQKPGAAQQLAEASVESAPGLTNKLGLQDIPYITDDSFIAAPLNLLGQVVIIRKTKSGEQCATSIADGASVEFAAIGVQGYDIDDSSVLKTPQKRQSVLVDQAASANVKFLSYLSAGIDTKSVLSIVLFDQAAGRVDEKKPSWNTAIATWKTANAGEFTDPNVCYIWVVKGVIEKNVVWRKFTQVDGNAAAGAYGVNIGGKLHSASEDYSVDIRYGLSPGILRRPGVAATGLGHPDKHLELPITKADINAIQAITKIRRPARK